LPFVSAGAHAPHSDETLGPTATRGSSHSARRLRSLAFLCSPIVSILRLAPSKSKGSAGSLPLQIKHHRTSYWLLPIGHKFAYQAASCKQAT